MTTNGQPQKPSITEVARRYHAAAVAVATTFGIPLEEVLNERREIVTAVFMQASREGLKLPATVELPMLATVPPCSSPQTVTPRPRTHRMICSQPRWRTAAMTTIHVHLSREVTCTLHQGERCQWLDISDAHGNAVVVFASDAQLLRLVHTITGVLARKEETTHHADADPAAPVSDRPAALGAAHLSDNGRPGGDA